MKSDAVYLQHILDAVHKIESYVTVGRDVFMSTSHWQDAVIRPLEIIGEATKALSGNLRSKHPEVPWQRTAGLRGFLIHEYFDVDLVAFWDLTQTGLPGFKKQVASILKELA
ncbi:MAG: DUF86 domain-containing protein [Terriglobia bacterium]|jgi:uncharacterized protein with HEPN domain